MRVVYYYVPPGCLITLLSFFLLSPFSLSSSIQQQLRRRRRRTTTTSSVTQQQSKEHVCFWRSVTAVVVVGGCSLSKPVRMAEHDKESGRMEDYCGGATYSPAVYVSVCSYLPTIASIT